jgi:hypothetical protein
MNEEQRQIFDSLVCAIQLELDKKAHARSYDNMLSLCSYATSTNSRFRTDADLAVAWRDTVWAKGYEILDAVIAGERPIPTREELLAELPVFEWPE